ncbi:MAG: hypothetical protein CL940_04820 [Deltaproteobacteria bacterium]|nr:hypothetical protein [Deltaproteobacteria bacterium]
MGVRSAFRTKPLSTHLAWTSLLVSTLFIGCSTVSDTAGEQSGDVGGFDVGNYETVGSLDVVFVPEDGTGTDGSTAGGFLTPCADNAECFSGWCVDSPEGEVCSKNCDDDAGCPDGWSCSQVTAGGADPAFICVANDARLCRPCVTDDDCNVPGFPTEGLCIQTGPGGSFCTRGCGDGLSCPDPFTCEITQPYGPDGPTLELCVTAELSDCSCTEKYVSEGATTSCYVENEHGRCVGQAACVDVGELSECDALSPAPESCNGVDDDCDGEVDEGAVECTDFYLDTDGDGYGQGLPTCACESPDAGWVPAGGDCNELVTGINPGATETCNGMDDDCDGEIDEEDASGCVTQYRDEDGDGYGLELDSKCLCQGSPGWSTQFGDCNDFDKNVHPDVDETCNTIDDDCDGAVDEVGADGCSPYWLDQDGDSYGLEDKVKCLCGPTGAYIGSAPGDCDDLDAGVHPGVTELCNGNDDNCNGETDEGENASMCPQVAHGVAGCLEGNCQLIDCEEGWSDADGDQLNGCECPGGTLELGGGTVGQSCLEPVDLGAVTDSGAVLEVTDNIAPEGDEDWYSFTAIDGADPESCDSFDLHVDFIHNPQGQFVFDVYETSCAASGEICKEVTEFTDSTNFLTTVGGDSPEPLGECPCQPGEDTVEGFQQCTDQTSVYILRVYRAPGFGPSCSAYTLRVRNGAPQ